MEGTRTVADNAHFVIRTVHCADHGVGWSAPEAATATQFVLVQRGRFRLRSHGRRLTVDPTSGYLLTRGQEARFAHPAGADVCTAISVYDDGLAAAIESAATPAVRVDARLELAHRLLLRSTADPDFAAAEAVVTLVRLARRHQPEELPAPGRHELADRARDAILAGEPGSTSLIALSHLLETSPSHLSRTFRHHSGMSISRYRNRVRVSRALQRLAEGEADIAGLAVGLGFSDQAHFTRVMRAETGDTPAHVRRLLSAGPPSP